MLTVLRIGIICTHPRTDLGNFVLLEVSNKNYPHTLSFFIGIAPLLGEQDSSFTMQGNHFLLFTISIWLRV
jgi:hypothetical protein